MSNHRLHIPLAEVYATVMSLKTARLILLGFLLTFASAFAAPPSVVTAKTGMDAERLGNIPVRMKSFVDKGTVAGTVTLVARHGAIASLEAVGYQDLESKKPMKPDTIFQIMSMTKPVVATAIMMLMEEGKLAIADPVENYLPEFKDIKMIDPDRPGLFKKPSRPITLRDLMTHTSGMYSVTPPHAFKDLKTWMGMTLAEVVSVGAKQPLNFEPGTKWDYSSVGIATLGRIIEVVSDQPFERFLESRIFEPLGMKDTYIFPPESKWDRIASCYVLDHGKLKKMGEDTLGGGDLLFRKGAKYSLPEGGLYSTATDMAAFYQLILNGGTYKGKRMLSKPTVSIMTENHTGHLPAGHSPGMGYGLAWAVVREPMGSLSLPLLSIGSYGHGGAFGTHGWVDPQKDLVGVFLVQRPGASAERNAFMAIAGSAILD